MDNYRKGSHLVYALKNPCCVDNEIPEAGTFWRLGRPST